MKRIVQINSVVKTGSTGRIVVDLDNILKKDGWETFIFFGRKKGQSESRIKIGSGLGVLFHIFITRFFDFHGLASCFATIHLVRQLCKIKPDVVHLHNIHGYYLNYILLFRYLKKSGIPVIWTLHDCWSFTGHCAYFDSCACQKWKVLCSKCQEKHSYTQSFFIDNSRINFQLKKKYFSSLRNMTLVVPSNWLAKTVSQSFLARFPLKVIRNGIDTNVFHPTEGKIRIKLGIENKFVILGVASVWSERKGFTDFLRLADMLGDNDRIVLVGLSVKQSKFLPKNIIAIPQTESQSELSDIYSSANVFFNPSVEETQGLTTVESLACGTPSIVYNATAVPEAVDHLTGYIVSQHDLKKVCTIIEQLKRRTKSESEGQQKACRMRALQLYRKEDRFQEYINLYNKLICVS